MKLSWVFVLCSSLLGMCSFGPGASVADRTLEYQVDQNRYAVVVVLDGISLSSAKKEARKRAAEVTVSIGRRYFTIEEETQIQVVKSSDTQFGSDPFYQNMYQELIIEGDFNKERLSHETEPNSQVYPALRLVFQPTLEKEGRRSIDACKYTHCP